MSLPGLAKTTQVHLGVQDLSVQKWGDYDALGEAVAPTKFVPMKTPLGREILEDWNLEEPPRHPLSIAILQKQQTLHGKRIGMIIDLSNHDSLYGADLLETGIQYERVPVSSCSLSMHDLQQLRDAITKGKA